MAFSCDEHAVHICIGDDLHRLDPKFKAAGWSVEPFADKRLIDLATEARLVRRFTGWVSAMLFCTRADEAGGRIR